MKIFVLMGQRNENYPGEYAPEALACMDEVGQSDNPDYLDDAKAKADASGDFERTEIIGLQADSATIMKILRPAAQVIEVSIISD